MTLVTLYATVIIKLFKKTPKYVPSHFLIEMSNLTKHNQLFTGIFVRKCEITRP